MRYPTPAAALTMTVLAALSFAQSPDDREDRHPQHQNAAPAPTQPAYQPIWGMMPMMNTMMMLGWAG
jgi:hypothetical protein